MVQDDSEDSSDSEDEIDVAGRKLAKKYKDNPSGLDAYCEQKKREISQRYIAEANRVNPEDRDPLREQRDESLRVIAEKRAWVLDYIQSQESETDYGSWTTRRNSSASENGSDQGSTNQNLPSSSSANQEPSSTNQESSSANQESSSTSATGSRFKQDSSDVKPENDLMDFDDPIG